MFAIAVASILVMGAQDYRTIVVTQDTVLTPKDVLRARIVVKASHITLDGQDLELVGPGNQTDLKSFEGAGPAILVEGCTNVTIKNVKARGFETGLMMKDCRAPVVEACDFSRNYTNPEFGWGEMPPRGGMILEGVRWGVFRNNKANQVWDALSLRHSDDNLFVENDLSHTTNTCAKLWDSSRNKFMDNDLSYGIRIDRQKGEVHARDSTSVLIESGSDDNFFYRNRILHGGDGVFIRPLNGWVSKRNLFIENDTSYANNNCVESWSPGNIYIRNRANHGSYGFWLGGSDDTVLIGNEASYNGLLDGYHNAPEGGFGHGGIVIVGGSSTHTLVEGNRAVGNNGGGIVFRGDKDGSWLTRHWIIQQNHLEGNKWPIWGRFADWITIGANQKVNNGNLDSIEQTQNLESLTGSGQRAPVAKLRGPSRAVVGQEVAYDASLSRGGDGELSFRWQVGDQSYSSPVVRHTFSQPGFYRVGVNVVSNGLADLAFRDVVVVEKGVQEVGTEGTAVLWTGDNGYVFEDDEDAVMGSTSLRMTPAKYQGALATATLPGKWSVKGKKSLVFWMKAQNPNIPAFQEAGPVVTLKSSQGSIRLQPAKGRNLYVGLPYSEARENWMRIEVPLAGNEAWESKTEGKLDLAAVQSISIGMDSWGGEPFTLWIDGMHFE
jgi:parallel beta-helix repeat protein